MALHSPGAMITAARPRPESPLRSTPRVALRPLALPNEHGGWGFLFEPVVLALLIAPSWSGLFIGIGALAAFLSRHPLRLAASDFLRGRAYPRTRVCVLLALGYGSLAVVGLGGAAALAGWSALVPLAFGAVLGLVQFTYDARNRGRALPAEIAGGLASSSIAASITLAGGKSLGVAAAVSLLVALRALSSIVFVRAALRSNGRVTSLLLHAAGIAAAVALWQMRVSHVLAMLAMAMLFARAAFTPRGTAARAIGYRELGWGTAFVVLVAVGYW